MSKNLVENDEEKQKRAERFKMLIDKLTVKYKIRNSIRGFSETVKVSNVTISNILALNNEIGLDTALEIKKTYNEINVNWLLTGEGEMLLSETENNSDTVASNDYIAIVKTLSAEISYLREELQEYKKLHNHATKPPTE